MKGKNERQQKYLVNNLLFQIKKVSSWVLTTVINNISPIF